MLGGAVIGVLPNVKLVGWEKVNFCLLKAPEDGPCNAEEFREGRPHLRCCSPGHSPFFISRVSWSCCRSASTSTSGSCFSKASTATRPPLRRKLKSPNQKTSSNRVVTSPGHMWENTLVLASPYQLQSADKRMGSRPRDRASFVWVPFPTESQLGSSSPWRRVRGAAKVSNCRGLGSYLCSLGAKDALMHTAG